MQMPVFLVFKGLANLTIKKVLPGVARESWEISAQVKRESKSKGLPGLSIVALQVLKWPYKHVTFLSLLHADLKGKETL